MLEISGSKTLSSRPRDPLPGLDNAPRGETRFRENHCSQNGGRFPVWVTIRNSLSHIFDSDASFLITFLQILVIFVLVSLTIAFVITTFVNLLNEAPLRLNFPKCSHPATSHG